MKRLALVLAVLLVGISLAGWVIPDEHNDLYINMNQARAEVTAESFYSEGYVQYRGETVDYDRSFTAQGTTFYNDYSEQHYYESITNGTAFNYYVYTDGDYYYYYTPQNGDKIKIRRIGSSNIVAEMSLPFSPDAMIATQVTELEGGRRQLRIDYDLTLAPGDSYLNEYCQNALLTMGLFGAEMNLTRIRYEFVVDEDYQLQIYRYGEMGTLEFEDGSEADYRNWYSSRYTYGEIEPLDIPIDRDDLNTYALRAAEDDLDIPVDPYIPSDPTID